MNFLKMILQKQEIWTNHGAVKKTSTGRDDVVERTTSLYISPVFISRPPDFVASSDDILVCAL